MRNGLKSHAWLARKRKGRRSLNAARFYFYLLYNYLLFTILLFTIFYGGL